MKKKKEVLSFKVIQEMRESVLKLDKVQEILIASILVEKN